MAAMPPQLFPVAPKPTAPVSPLAAPGVLGAALKAQALKNQATSLAGSALAKKSHPQTANQPPVAPPLAQATPQPQAQAAPPSLADIIKTYQTQLVNAQNQVNTTGQQLDAANQLAMPTAPTYTAPAQPKPDLGGALGAALAGLFAPHRAQGAINGLGVTQQNQKDQYDKDLAASQNAYKVGQDAYGNQVDARQKAIENAERANIAAGRRVDSLDTGLRSALNEQESEAIRQASLDEKTKNDAATQQHRDRMEKIGFANLGLRRQALQNTINHQAEVLAFDNTKLLDTNNLKQMNYASTLYRFGVHEKDAMNVSNMRVQAEMILQQSREWQQNHRDLVKSANTFIGNSQKMFVDLMTHNQPQAARAAALSSIGFLNSPAGISFRAALASSGVSGSMAEDELNAATEAEYGTDPVLDENNKVVKKPLKAVPEVAADAGDPNLAKIPQVSGDVDPTLLAWANSHGVNFGGPATPQGGEPVQQQPQPHQQPQPKPPQGDQVVHQLMPLAQKDYQAALAYYKDPNKAWTQAVLPGLQAKHIPMAEQQQIRRALMGGGDSGKAQPLGRQGMRIAPLPTLQQGMTSAGISPELIP